MVVWEKIGGQLDVRMVDCLECGNVVLKCNNFDVWVDVDDKFY